MKSPAILIALLLYPLFYSAQSPKLGTAIIANPPCIDEGFEGLTVGPLVSAGWTPYYQTNPGSSMLCGSPLYSPGNIRVQVVSTPTIDSWPNTFSLSIPNSPYPGTKAMRVNYNGWSPSAKADQTFSVTAGNFVYRYAYMGYIDGGHTICDGSALAFRFYDCSNTLISAISKTLSNVSNPDVANWVPLTVFGASITPNWVEFDINLVNYIGSCIRVEVAGTGCINSGHIAYCYYDADCSDRIIKINNKLAATGSFTSCSSTATLSGLPGFSTYLWQGPVASGVSGSTLSSVSSSVAGVYTLTASNPTISFTQTVQLQISNLTQPTITGNFSVCAGQSATLQLSGSGIQNNTWSGPTGTLAANTSSLVYSPAVLSSVVFASGTFSNSCAFTTSVLIVHNFPAVVTPATATLSTICSGNSVSIGFNPVLGQTIAWSNGATLSTIVVSPSVNTQYSATLTTAAGCTATGFHIVNVNPTPQLNLSGATICQGQSATLSSGFSIGNHLWSNGGNTPSITVSPFTTTTYSLSYLTLAGCLATGSTQVIVLPLPGILNPNVTTSVCSGGTVQLMLLSPSINSYTWSNGASGGTIVVSPTVNSVYTATIMNGFFCKTTASQTVLVVPLPLVSVVASASSVCEGEKVLLTATSNTTGSYLWSSGGTTSMQAVQPMQSGYYYVTFTDANTCQDSAGVSLQVLACTGLSPLGETWGQVQIFPNPSTGSVFFEAQQNKIVEIWDAAGRLVRAVLLSSETRYRNELFLPPGVYLCKSGRQVQKLVITGN